MTARPGAREGEAIIMVPDGHGGERPATTADADECARIGHDPTPGLRHSEARQQMVADCRRCGAEFALFQPSRSTVFGDGQ